MADKVVEFDRAFTLDVGAKQTLAAVLPSLPDLVNGWQDQIQSGQIDQQFRDIAVALGWITQRDSRVHPIRRASRPKDTVTTPMGLGVDGSNAAAGFEAGRIGTETVGGRRDPGKSSRP